MVQLPGSRALVANRTLNGAGWSGAASVKLPLELAKCPARDDSRGNEELQRNQRRSEKTKMRQTNPNDECGEPCLSSVVSRQQSSAGLGGSNELAAQLDQVQAEGSCSCDATQLQEITESTLKADSGWDFDCISDVLKLFRGHSMWICPEGGQNFEMGPRICDRDKKAD